MKEESFVTYVYLGFERPEERLIVSFHSLAVSNPSLKKKYFPLRRARGIWKCNARWSNVTYTRRLLCIS